MIKQQSKKDLIKSKAKRLMMKQRFKLLDNFEVKEHYYEEMLNCGKFTIELFNQLLELYTVTLSLINRMHHLITTQQKTRKCANFT